MLGWMTAISLYLLGLAAVSAMGKEISTAPRSRRTRIRLLLWPPVVFFGWCGDVYDWSREKLARFLGE